MNRKTLTCGAYTKAVNEADRTVEQIVSVFGNVDLGGDRVVRGAFANTLEQWKSSPNTMPAYFSHQWEDPFANIGGVTEAEELAPGDARLPNDQVVTEDGKTLRELGGLLVKYQFDEEGLNPFADQVFRLLAKRRIVQASFAYDIVSKNRNSDGTQDLTELKLIEVGPTLLGMNPATTLLASSRKSIAELAKASGLDEKDVELVMKAAKDISHTFISSNDDPTRCSFCGKTRTAVAHLNTLSDDTGHGMKTASFVGSVEVRQEAIFELGRSWAMENDIGNGGYYCTYLVATFDDRAIFLVEGWSDPIGEGRYFEAAVTTNDDGTYSMGEPEEVVVETTVVPKLRNLTPSAKKTARNAKEAATIANDEEEGTGSGNGETGNGNPETSPETESESEEDEDDGEAERMRLEAEAQLLETI